MGIKFEFDGMFSESRQMVTMGLSRFALNIDRSRFDLIP